MRRIRLFVLCAVAVVTAGQALAGFDGSVLRGSADGSYGGEPVPAPPRFLPRPPSYWRWEGFYAGGQVGVTNAAIDFGTGTRSLIDYILRNDVVLSHVSDWTTLSKVGGTKGTYGGFVGYNAQWDGNLIIGLEANYTRMLGGGVGGSAADSMTRAFQDDTGAPATHHYFYTATVSSRASGYITDLATARARAGIVIDRFLPYAFVGAAVARIDVVRTATVSYNRQDIPDATTPPALPITPEADFNFGPQSRGVNRKGVFAYGFAGGLGIDVALLPNVFVRAEWEYVQLSPVEDFKIHLGSGRVGVGIKF